MTRKQVALWCSGLAVTLVAVVVGPLVGALAFEWATNSGLDEFLSPGAALGLMLSMFGGLLVAYVVLFSLWVAVSRRFVSSSDLLAVSENTRFQGRHSASINRKWMHWILRRLGLDGNDASGGSP